MAQIATTIEQSKKLWDLGLDPESADMCWGVNGDTGKYNNQPYQCPWKDYTAREYYVPAWSIGSLLSILRSYTDCNKLEVFTNRAQKWSVTISYYDSVWKEHDEVNINLMDSIVDTVVFLLENNYLTTENK